MLLRTVVSPLLGAVCTVVADDQGRCVAVDPGAGVAAEVARVAAAEGWRPVGVLLTHGHLDHAWDAGALAEAWGIAVHVHAGDRYRLDDPVGSLGPLGGQLVSMVGGDVPPAPARVVELALDPGVEAVLTDAEGGLLLADGDRDASALRALHVPGHTEGSTTYLLDADGPVALTGDVLFAGSIGRTDLPGGDATAMAGSLRVLAGLDPTTRVVPGHGPTSTLGTELTTNPYLRAAR